MAKNRFRDHDTHCPCGGKTDFDECCGPYLRGREAPTTAEQLMRSRYCGYVMCNEQYLLDTWHADTRPSRISFDRKQRWLGLSVRATESGTSEDMLGSVEYIARYKIDGKGYRLHEISRFSRVDGLWYYIDGQHLKR